MQIAGDIQCLDILLSPEERSRPTTDYTDLEKNQSSIKQQHILKKTTLQTQIYNFKKILTTSTKQLLSIRVMFMSEKYPVFACSADGIALCKSRVQHINKNLWKSNAHIP